MESNSYNGAEKEKLISMKSKHVNHKQRFCVSKWMKVFLAPPSTKIADHLTHIPLADTRAPERTRK